MNEWMGLIHAIIIINILIVIITFKRSRHCIWCWDWEEEIKKFNPQFNFVLNYMIRSFDCLFSLDGLCTLGFELFVTFFLFFYWYYACVWRFYFKLNSIVSSLVTDIILADNSRPLSIFDRFQRILFTQKLFFWSTVKSSAF